MPTAKVQVNFSDGTKIQEWESFSIRDTYTDPIGAFTFVAKPDQPRLFYYLERLKKGELIAVLVNEVPQFVGLINTVVVTISPENGTTIEASGGTPLLTPYEGHGVEDPNDYSKDLTFKADADVPVKEFLLRVLRPYGFTGFATDDRVHVDVITNKPVTKKKRKTNTDALQHSEAQVHPGEGAYAACARVVTRLGCVMRLNWKGEIMVTNPDYEQDPSYTLVQDFNANIPGDRFFGDITITDTNEGQFSECAVRGQKAIDATDTFTARPIDVARSSDLNADRPPYRSTIAVYKPKIIQDKSSRDKDRAKSTAKLALGIPACRAFVVRGQVSGFISSTGRVWNVDTKAHVILRAAGIEEDMWILSREFVQDAQGGQITRLELIPPGYLTIGDAPGN